MSNLVQHQGFAPTTLTEAMQFSEMLAASSMVPKAYQGKAQDVLVAVQWGYEIGLQPLQALQNISVINGKPSVYGDAAMALVQASPVCEDIEEFIEGEGTPNPIAVCIAKRKGRKPVVAKFSVEDAKRAGLWGKAGPWQAYPKRMMQMRARGFALRDAFPDVLKGLITAEEAQDYPDEAKPGVAPAATQAISHNPLDKLAPPKVAAPAIEEVVVTEDTQDAYVAQVEEVNQMLDEEANSRSDEVLTRDQEMILVEDLKAQFEANGVEVVEITEAPAALSPWVLSVPDKPDQPMAGYTEWAEAYEALADKVAHAGKASGKVRLEKLASLRQVNEPAFKALSLDQQLYHSRQASKRRQALGEIEG